MIFLEPLEGDLSFAANDLVLALVLTNHIRIYVSARERKGSEASGGSRSKRSREGGEEEGRPHHQSRLEEG